MSSKNDTVIVNYTCLVELFMHGKCFLFIFLEFQEKISVISMTYLILWADLCLNCVTLALIMIHDLPLKRMEFRLEDVKYLFRKC